MSLSRFEHNSSWSSDLENKNRSALCPHPYPVLYTLSTARAQKGTGVQLALSTALADPLGVSEFLLRLGIYFTRSPGRRRLSAASSGPRARLLEGSHCPSLPRATAHWAMGPQVHVWVLQASTHGGVLPSKAVRAVQQ